MKDHAREKNNVDKTEKKPITTPTPLPSKLERNHSLDAEPKTLLQEEINLAREAALKIINTHPKEEALKIFLKGLVPVTSSKQGEEEAVMSDCEDYDVDDDE
ncbi:uncharacterized protein [Cicer arietinum]|uniref:Uncharacterized protein LOC101514596 n=1 Tax=Cicer arietinum TaxID=3827 RepID=A0A1S2YBZ1_CICAR|nr:uncharacterized protein LOC101514596 [Cicer arietinum]